ncbi:MAG: hypothetical protein JRE27_07000, partial [Deltaproteobacteria bacterium]|nr:hypothetical protein [Deltaproteobacteria bacterium]
MSITQRSGKKTVSGWTLDMLPNPIPIIIDDPDLDFPKAVQIVKEQAREI